MEKLMNVVKVTWTILFSLAVLMVFCSNQKPVFAGDLVGGIKPTGFFCGQSFAIVDDMNIIPATAGLFYSSGSGAMGLEMGKEVDVDGVEMIYFYDQSTGQKVYVYPNIKSSTIDELKTFFSPYVVFDNGVGVLPVRLHSSDGVVQSYIFSDLNMAIEYVGWDNTGVIDITSYNASSLLWLGIDTGNLTWVNYSQDVLKTDNGIVNGVGIAWDYEPGLGITNQRFVVSKIGLNISLVKMGNIVNVTGVPSDIYIFSGILGNSGEWIINLGQEYQAFDLNGNLAFSIDTTGTISSYGDMYQGLSTDSTATPIPSTTNDITLSGGVLKIANVYSHFFDSPTSGTVSLVGDFNGWVSGVSTSSVASDGSISLNLTNEGIDSGTQRITLVCNGIHWLDMSTFSATDQANAWDMTSSSDPDANGDWVIGLQDGAWTTGTTINH